MKKIYFATTNVNKITEASELLGKPVAGYGLAVDEIQSLKSEEVVTKKALAYFAHVKKPIFVEDTCLSFKALNGLPGTYINDFWDSLGNIGLCKLLDNFSDRSAEAKVTIAFIKAEDKIHLFEGVVKGTIAKKPVGDKGFGWDAIFTPEGAKKTFGQMELAEKNKYSMRALAFEKFRRWLDMQK